MIGTIIQLNVSHGGVPKHPIEEAFLGPLGLDGDAHAHPHLHGGPSKAVLLISDDAIRDLVAQGYPVYNGALGENLTIRGIERTELRSGQRFRVGQAVIELTKLRSPCANLDVYGPTIKAAIYDAEAKAGNASSPKWAMGGFYASVVRTGLIRRDDIIALVDQVV